MNGDSEVIKFYNESTAGQNAAPWEGLSSAQRESWRINYETRVQLEGIPAYVEPRFPLAAVVLAGTIILIIIVVTVILAANG